MRDTLAVIGGGSAGFAAATKANDLKVKTALINEGEIGGTCVNRGCVPSKVLLEIGNIAYRAAHSGFESIAADMPVPDFDKAIREKRQIVDTLRQSNYTKVIETMHSVDLYKGKGKLLPGPRIEVNGEVLEADNVIIASGASPKIVPFKGLKDIDALTSTEALDLEERPDSLVVVGGRALALEFAQIYSRLGVRVTILQRSPRILPDHEPEVSQEMTKCLTEEGINIFTNTKILGFSRGKSRKSVLFSSNGQKESLGADQILLATGRTPNTRGIGLERVGVKVDDRGFILTDAQLRTSNPRIYAAGDCTSPIMLETLAAKMGNVAASNILEGEKLSIDVHEIPRAIFTDPQVATVGYTDDEYSQRTGACSCRTIGMELVPKAQAVRDTRGIVKMVIDPSTERIVGVHIVSPLAAEMIHEATLIVRFALTLDDVIATTHVFPTLSEGIKRAAQSFKRDISSMSCCIE